MAIIEVIKYDGPPGALAWKHPNEEIGAWSQLIVSETQEAILFKNGQAMDSFGPGRHTLETANLPLLSKLINLPLGGSTSYSAEVWYVNKLVRMGVKWGTATPIQMQDPKYGIFVSVRSFGQFAVRVTDARRFLLKLAASGTCFDENSLIRAFRGLLMTEIKDTLSSYMMDHDISVFEISANLTELGDHIRQAVVPVYAGYGLELPHFNIESINIPDTDESVVRLKKAWAKRVEVDIVGYTYDQERQFDIIEQVGGQTAATLQKNCRKCEGVMEARSKFCPHCGEKQISICARCGHEMQAGHKFCDECGLAAL
ncbi:SPFH domain-containing protein [Paenibacillus glufosinatiresistens]|uniref:SPFH domain-containing protein n=1 Tax=Paenibacillus glufosinatiresistens TaxID=3070657 RepID=UPI00286D873E|nr:SPFH domain-containing protein [Paenibacillus sp. YX.27]